MQQPSLAAPIYQFEQWLSAFFDSRFWKARLIGLAILISIGSLLALNSVFIDRGFRYLYEEIRQPGRLDGFFWDDIIRQSDRMFEPNTYEPGTHEANQTFRLTIPMMVHFFRLGVAKLYLLQLVLGVVFLWAVTSIANRVLQDKVLTFYFLTGFTAIYAGAAFVINYFGHCDAYVYCFMALALYFRNPLLVILFSQLAFWCDERALINSTYIGLWYLLPLIQTVVKTRKFELRLIPAPLVALVVSVMLYGATRKWLELTYGMTVGHDASWSARTLAWSMSYVGDKMARGLEGMWLILLAAFWALAVRRQWLELVLLGGAWALTMLVSVLVADGTRSLSFGFMAFFFALAILKRYLSAGQLRFLLLSSVVISLMYSINFP
ncbi:hypothetical protein ACFQ4C_22510 [Larkinella insperata]|uniref:EpsG-like glucosyltransferase n=1 Tax=Larkinella insperata TaxID=332158 RepID=A0ABW3QNP1_9BACT|nr:hypothetical protein [Larkinella insperata]